MIVDEFAKVSFKYLVQCLFNTIKHNYRSVWVHVWFLFLRNAGKRCLFFRSNKLNLRSSRYVLLTFPQTPVRYKAPTYVERILLPERFPNLFQNIVHHRNPK